MDGTVLEPGTGLEPQAVLEPQAGCELIAGRYRPLRRLGSGGMGTVWLVEDARRGGSRLALKRASGRDRRAKAALRREFLAQLGLSHPGLARAHDFGWDARSGSAFFTSEFIDGTSWLEAVEPLLLSREGDLLRFLDLVAQAARALEFIHSRGLIHGDVKAENALVAAGAAGGGAPRLLLIDFGLVARAGFVRRTRREAREILGTPYYLAPEVILGRRADRRSDLYSLGVVLYQLTTGTLPFAGESRRTVLRCHLDAPPRPPRELSESVPPALSAIILRLLEKEPRSRFQSALEVIDEVNRAFSLDLPLETPETASAYVAAAALSGCGAEVAILRSALRSRAASRGARSRRAAGARSGRGSGRGSGRRPPGPCVVLLAGGRGDSAWMLRRLARDLRARAQARGASFLELQCAPGDPLREWESLAAALEDHEQAWRGEAAPSHTESVLEPGDDLRRGRGALPAASALPRPAEIAIDLLESSLERPIAIHVHGLAAGDGPLAALVGSLREAIEEERVPGSRILVTASVEAAPGPGRRSIAPFLAREGVLEVVLRELDAASTRRLLRRAFPGASFPEALTGELLAASGGSHESLLGTLRGWVENGRIERTLSGWVAHAERDDAERAPRLESELAVLIDRFETAREMARAFDPHGAIHLYRQALALAENEALLDGRSIARTVRRELADVLFEAGDYGGAEEIHSPLLREEAGCGAASDLLFLLAAARVRARRGRFEEASTILERAGAASSSHPIPFLVTSAELHLRRGDPRESLRQGNQLLEMEGQIASPVLAADLHVLLAESHLLLANRETAAGHFLRAARMLQGHGDLRLVALRLYARGRYHACVHHHARAARQLKLSCLLWRRLGAADRQADCLFELGRIEHGRGRPWKARRSLELAVEIYGEGGNAPQRARAECALADVSRELGEHERSARLLSDALRVAVAGGDRRLEAEVLLAFAASSFDQGDLENAGRYLYEAESHGDVIQEHVPLLVKGRALRARLTFERGEPESALEHVSRALAAARRARDDLASAEILADRARFLCARRGPRGARRAPGARKAVLLLRATARRRRLGRLEGWSWLLEAALLMRKGSEGKAERAMERARRAIEAHGSDRDLVHLALERGLLCLARGAHGEAAAALVDGLHVATRLGITGARCRLAIALGRVELAAADGSRERAESHLRLAEKLAARGPYPALAREVEEVRDGGRRGGAGSAGTWNSRAEVRML